MNTAIIIGFIILGVCLIGCSFVLSGAITGAAAALKSTDTQTLQQPTMSFLTEFDAADYLGLSLNELDYMRSEGLLDNTFIAITSLERTGEEEYPTSEDGISVTKVRPVVSSVTRFLYNTQLLDQRMLELIEEGKHINPSRKRQNQSQEKTDNKSYSKSQDKPSKKEPKESKEIKDTKESKEPKEQKQPKETKEKPVPSYTEDTLSEFVNDEQALIAASESEYSDDDDYREDEYTVKPVKKVSDEQHRQNGNNRPSGQNGSGKKNGKKNSNKNSNHSSSKKPYPYNEDDSDMKIVGSKSKPSVTVYSEKGYSSNASSPVYSTSDDDEDITIIKPVKPAQKTLSKPRIAVISSDDDDNNV